MQNRIFRDDTKWRFGCFCYATTIYNWSRAVITLNNYFNNKEVKKGAKMEILSISKKY